MHLLKISNHLTHDFFIIIQKNILIYVSSYNGENIKEIIFKFSAKISIYLVCKICAQLRF